MTKPSFVLSIIAVTAVLTLTAAGTGKFDGEFSDKKFLNGQAVFEFSIQQSGNALNIAFDAAYSDGHGAAPDATGSG